MRRCGNDFVRRRDAFRRAYDAQCTQDQAGENQDIVDINSCGLKLREHFGFPDARCPNDSPMAELDGAILVMPDIPENEGEVLTSAEQTSEEPAAAKVDPPSPPSVLKAAKSPDSQIEQEAPVPADAGDVTL